MDEDDELAAAASPSPRSSARPAASADAVGMGHSRARPKLKEEKSRSADRKGKDKKAREAHKDTRHYEKKHKKDTKEAKTSEHRPQRRRPSPRTPSTSPQADRLSEGLSVARRLRPVRLVDNPEAPPPDAPRNAKERRRAKIQQYREYRRQVRLRHGSDGRKKPNKKSKKQRQRLRELAIEEGNLRGKGLTNIKGKGKGKSKGKNFTKGKEFKTEEDESTIGGSGRAHGSAVSRSRSRSNHRRRSPGRFATRADRSPSGSPVPQRQRHRHHRDDEVPDHDDDEVYEKGHEHVSIKVVREAGGSGRSAEPALGMFDEQHQPSFAGRRIKTMPDGKVLVLSSAGYLPAPVTAPDGRTLYRFSGIPVAWLAPVDFASASRAMALALRHKEPPGMAQDGSVLLSGLAEHLRLNPAVIMDAALFSYNKAAAGGGSKGGGSGSSKGTSTSGFRFDVIAELSPSPGSEFPALWIRARHKHTIPLM
jgi:hypothetical protein